MLWNLIIILLLIIQFALMALDEFIDKRKYDSLLNENNYLKDEIKKLNNEIKTLKNLNIPNNDSKVKSKRKRK